MKHIKWKLILSIVFLVFGIQILFSGIAYTFTRKVTSFSTAEQDCTVQLAEVKKIGSIYSETIGDETISHEADVGYTIYEIIFSVTNVGLEEYYSEGPDIYFEGYEYSDVYELWDLGYDYEEDPLFYYDSQPYLPAGRSVDASYYVQVKDGVSEFTASYRPSYDADEVVLSIPVE